jgi:hypothetical protein
LNGDYSNNTWNDHDATVCQYSVFVSVLMY